MPLLWSVSEVGSDGGGVLVERVLDLHDAVTATRVKAQNVASRAGRSVWLPVLAPAAGVAAVARQVLVGAEEAHSEVRCTVPL